MCGIQRDEFGSGHVRGNELVREMEELAEAWEEMEGCVSSVCI
jgi:hypothetical protein